MRAKILEAFFDQPDTMRGVFEVADDKLTCAMLNRAAATSLFGSTPESVVGAALSGLGVDAETCTMLMERCDESRQTEQPVLCDFAISRGDTPRSVRAALSHFGDGEHGQLFTFTATDSTATTIAEEAMRRTEESYATLVRNLSGAVYRSRSANRSELEHIGENCLDITGYRQDELCGPGGLSLDKLIHPDEAPVVRARYAANLSSRSECNSEYRIVRKDGEVRWVWDRAHGIYGRDGELLRVEGLLMDITARRRDAEERQALREQLSHMQRVDSIGRLAGGVAHDFNNLLAVVLGHTELIAAQMTEDDPIAENVAEIRSATERSVHLTRQLLGFASKQPNAPRVVELNDVVADILRLLRRIIGEGVDVRWIPDAAAWPVKIDPTQLDQILTNLCVNARDAMRGTGHITITTSNVALDSAFMKANPGSRAGEFAVLRVEDSGSGMDAAVLSHVFEPFFTTKPRGRGTGLGLSTVYGILKQNDGYIDIKSTAGVGTTVTVYLPRHAEPTDNELGIADVDLEMEGGTETILLVEDEPALLRITKRILSRLGYIVLSAATPNDAVRRVVSNLDRVQLLVTDIVLPEMNGMRLADFLQTQKPGLPVLFMSGYADTAFDDGVIPQHIHFIAKPFTPQQLATKVREALAGPPTRTK